MNSIEWLSRLIAIDTTSRHTNLQLIQLIKDWLNQYGLPIRLTYDESKTKANLLATLPAHNGRLDGGIILSGHTDVVPVDGQHWDTNPFIAVHKDDKIYGRGTSDMKGFLAVILAMVPTLQKMQLSHPIHFAFSYDEEVGCRGAPVMIADLERAGIKPQVCIVGEPTMMQAVVAHKGIQVFRCRVHGQAAHSSLTTQGCNAIEYAAQVICHLRKLAEQMRHEGPFDHHYDVPFTTLTTNMIKGGIALNVIPDLCEFFFEFRQLPQVKPSMIIEKIQTYITNDLLPMMQKEKSSTHIEIDQIAAAPSFETHENDIIKSLKQLTDTKDIHKVAYATEAGLFQHAHIPTVVCGPGSIEQAHRANEFIEIAQLEKCEAILRQAVAINLNE